MSRRALAVLSFSSFKFSMRFLLINQHRIISVLYAYQNDCRIYLDEYEGQKELREEWFKLNRDYFKIIDKTFDILKK